MLLRSGLLLVFLSAAAADAQLYTYRDADGVFHFTKVRVPDAEPFEVPPEPGRPAPKPGVSGHVARERAEPLRFDPIIHEVAGRYDVEPELVMALIHVESRFDPKALSPRGARGLMQLMPRTARRYGATDLNDPRQNIRAGVRYLRALLDRFDDDPRLALAAYNAGPSVVARYGGLPPYLETRAYVEKVLRFRRRYRANAAPVPGSEAVAAASVEPGTEVDSGSESGRLLVTGEGGGTGLLSFLFGQAPRSIEP